MNLEFECLSEHAMFVVRDSYMAPFLRRLKVRYRTDRYYPWECFSFGPSIPPYGSPYYMVFRILLEADDPLYSRVLEYARGLVGSVPEVVGLQD